MIGTLSELRWGQLRWRLADRALALTCAAGLLLGLQFGLCDIANAAPGPTPARLGSPPEATMHSLPRDMQDAFLNAVFHAIPANFVPYRIPIEVSRELREFWVGNKPDFKSSLKTLSMEFVVEAARIEGIEPDGSDSEDLPEVVYTVKFEIFNDVMFVTRDQILPGQRAKTGVAFRPDKVTKVFFEGPNRTSFVLVTPPRGENGTPAGFLMCPREFPKKVPGTFKAGSPLLLSNPGVRVRRITPVFEGKARTQLESFTQNIRGKLSIATTYDVAPSKAWLDQDEAKDITLELDYLPVDNWRFFPKPGAYDLKHASGIKMELDMRTEAGFRRVYTHEHGVWLDRMRYDPETEFHFRRLRARPDEGECFRIINRAIIEQVFTREDPLPPLPEDIIRSR